MQRDILEHVVPPERKAERGVDEALRELDVTTGNRKVSHHFTERDLIGACRRA